LGFFFDRNLFNKKIAAATENQSEYYVFFCLVFSKQLHS